MKNFILILIFLSFNFVLIAQKSICQGDCENGFGILITSSGNRYEGNWKNGIKHGKFKYLFSNGTKFEGEVKDGLINGMGVYETLEYKLVGQLIQIKEDDNTYITLLNGSGEIIWKNGNFEKGIFINNVLNGRGERQFGSQYEKGTFVKGKLEGEEGYFKFSSGSIHTGTFVNGLANGKGRLTYPAGGYLQGNWLNGKCIDCQSNNSNNQNAITLIPRRNGMGYDLSVNIEGQLTIEMLFDTGADVVLLKKEHFFSLLAEGKIKGPKREANFGDAGGTTKPYDIYKIGSMKVGKYELKDVECAVNPETSKAPNLFGMSAIRKLGSQVVIDLQNNLLIVR